MTIDNAGNLYISDNDRQGDAGVLYKVSINGTQGVLTSLAGSLTVAGASDGPGMTATFDGLANLTADATGNIYANDYYNGTIREISAAGVVSTLAGVPGLDGLAFGALPQALPDIDALTIIGNALVASVPDDSVLIQIAPLP